MIKVYHKCLKTVMQIESYQATDTDRLAPAIPLTSATAITLLNLRDDSRDETTKDSPATEYSDTVYIEILRCGVTAWSSSTARWLNSYWPLPISAATKIE